MAPTRVCVADAILCILNRLNLGVCLLPFVMGGVGLFEGGIMLHLVARA